MSDADGAKAKLYSISISHPVQAVRAMLAYKGIEYEVVSIAPGTQPIVLRLAGFGGRTVPALKLEGRRVQGSTQISRALEEFRPNPPLFPEERRAEVEEAEAWGEREFQPLPRRFFRWAVAHNPEVRTGIARNALHLPAPDITSNALVPMARYFARLSRANDDFTREGLARLPGLLDHVDQLIADAVIGVEGEPTAADFQIASTIASLRGFEDTRPLLEGRPGFELAEKLFPRGGRVLPAFLPREWVETTATGSSATPS